MNTLFALMAIVDVNEERFARENFVYCTAIIIIFIYQRKFCNTVLILFKVLLYSHSG